jgi:hypothetical protein
VEEAVDLSSDRLLMMMMTVQICVGLRPKKHFYTRRITLKQ